MEKSFEILQLLGEGRARSGQELSTELGVSRAAVWKRVQRLAAAGVEVHAVPGKGYRLVGGFEALDTDTIISVLDPTMRHRVRRLTVVRATDSTNQQLLDRAASESIHGHVYLAEFQTAGRGRRGDVWVAPPGSGICMSCGWRFEVLPRALGALSLVVGVALVDALSALGAAGLRLKWPNDVMCAGHKLAGVLIEIRAESGGPCTTVIGIGVNARLSAQTRAAIAQPCTDLAELGVEASDRNRVVAAILASLFRHIDEFSERGFSMMRRKWNALDGLANRKVELTLPRRSVIGLARGVDNDGMLVLETKHKIERFVTGHLRLRG